RRVLTASRDNMVRVFDLQTGALLSSLLAPDAIEHTSDLSPSGDLVLTGVHNGDVLLWDLGGADAGGPREYQRLRAHAKGANALWLPDGGLLTLGRDGRVVRWRDELPTDPEDLRAWIEDRVDA